ncbi:MAG: SPOR domain-containing protein [Pseudomonadota bacterium]
MVKKKFNSNKEKRKYHIELTPVSIFGWGFGLFFLLSWIFVLGIMVGRGFLPGAVTALTDLKGQISKLQEMVRRNKSNDVIVKREPNPEPKLDFYEKLATKKEEAIKKQLPEGNEKIPQKVSEQQYTIQFASMEDINTAKDMVERLTGRGHPSFFYDVKIKGKTFYRVRSRKVMSKEDAQKYADKIEKEASIKGLVTRAE